MHGLPLIKLLLVVNALASSLPVLAEISNADSDGDGIGDVERILNSSKDLILAIEDVGVSGAYDAVWTGGNRKI